MMMVTNVLTMILPDIVVQFLESYMGERLLEVESLGEVLDLEVGLLLR